jgi:hypothetical protein
MTRSSVFEIEITTRMRSATSVWMSAFGRGVAVLLNQGGFKLITIADK